jgi:membrane associated rhomboid family serine protease
MDLTIFAQPGVAILAICIMIGAIIIARIKKFMIIYSLIFANIIVFIITFIFPNEILGGLDFIGLGFRPIYLSNEYFPQIYTIFTSMFVHGGFLHIFGNMFIFFLIGMPFEERIGAKKFIIIYLITGVVATLTHAMLNLESTIPLVGASGAIFGIMGAFAVSYPRDKIVAPIGIGIAFLMRIRVIYAVLFYAAIETFIVWYESNTGFMDNTAHYAHLGGLIAGFILGIILIRPKKVDSTGSFETVYHDPSAPPKSIKRDISELEQFATTPQLKDMLNKIKNENVPQVRDIWLEHFFEKAVCPKCGKPLNYFDKKIWCESCGFKTKY